MQFDGFLEHGVFSCGREAGVGRAGPRIMPHPPVLGLRAFPDASRAIEP
jgi:hypothetical protein